MVQAISSTRAVAAVSAGRNSGPRRMIGCTKNDAADDGHAFPTLWDIPWDVLSEYAHKDMRIQALTVTFVLTLPEPQ